MNVLPDVCIDPKCPVVDTGVDADDKNPDGVAGDDTVVTVPTSSTGARAPSTVGIATLAVVVAVVVAMF